MTGSQNINYKEKVKVYCDNCGKEIEKIPSLTHNINKQGENHNPVLMNVIGSFVKNIMLVINYIILEKRWTKIFAIR